MTASIKLGPAGSPAETTLEGISKVKELGLQSMEVQFSHGVSMGIGLAKQIGAEAKKQGVSLSVHAPYFINLASKEKKKIEESKKRILDSCERMHHMGGGAVVFHPSYFGGMGKEKVFQTTKDAVAEMLDKISESGWSNVQLAPETTGKHSALGSLDETIRLAKETGCFLCVDFAHLWARSYGRLDFREVFNKLETLKLKHLHCHFSGIEYTAKGERNHITIEHNKPPFKPLAEEILKRELDITIISESPVTYMDSIRMRKVFEELGYRF